MMLRGRFILLIGDDGVILVPPQGLCETVSVAGHDAASATTVAGYLDRAPRTEVRILVDLLAQELRTETLPPVGFLDRRALARRRCAQSFTGTTLAGTCSLERDKVLLAGLHQDGVVRFWLDRLAERGTPCGPVALLPVEGADLLGKLMPETRTGWGLMLTWQRTGGWRQIVTQDGQPVFTRLTPQLPFDATPREIATTVERDLQATLHYLTRLGLNRAEEMTLLVLAPAAAHPALNALRWKDMMTVMTPHEAATALGLGDSLDPDETCGDVLFAAAHQHRRPRLPLWTPASRKAWHQRLLRQGGMMLALALGLWSVGQTGADLIPLVRLHTQNTAAAIRLAQLQADLDHERALQHPAAGDLEKLRRAVERRRLFAEPRLSPWPLLAQSAAALPPDQRATSLHWQSPSGVKQDELLTLTLRLTGPASPDRANVRAKFQQATQALETALHPAYAVQMTHEPFALKSSETLSNQSEASTDPTATLDIRARAP